MPKHEQLWCILIFDQEGWQGTEPRTILKEVVGPFASESRAQGWAFTQGLRFADYAVKPLKEA